MLGCTHKISWPHELRYILPKVLCRERLPPLMWQSANSRSYFLFRAPNRQEHIFFHRSALQLDRKPDWGELPRLHQMTSASPAPRAVSTAVPSMQRSAA